MCCFSRVIKHVGGTKIFARKIRALGASQHRHQPERQALVYSMTVELDEPLAMILPLPVADGSGEDAVAFVDLTRYRTFFEDLELCFPLPPRASGPFAPAAARAMAAPLAVHEVGDYVASYVPSLQDFERLDERFRIPRSLATLHRYDDYGFAVFQLKPLAKAPQQTVQPMAFTFPSRRPDSLYFPTLHVHDGHMPTEAKFDHMLALQSDDPRLVETLGWRTSKYRVGKHVKTSKMSGLADPDMHAHKSLIFGLNPNDDVWLDPPEFTSADALSGQGASFSFKLDASMAHALRRDEKTMRHRETMRTQIDHLHRGLMTGLSALTTQHREDWGFTTVPTPTFWERIRGDEVPELWLSSRKAFGAFGPHGPQVMAPGTKGPFQVEIRVESQLVPRQGIRFIFAAVPSEAVLEAIERELAALFDRCVSATT